MVDRKHVADGLYRALERADHEYRARYPKQFSYVDFIKRHAGWRPWWEEPALPSKPCGKCGSTDLNVLPDGRRRCRDCEKRRMRAHRERTRRRP